MSHVNVTGRRRRMHGLKLDTRYGCNRYLDHASEELVIEPKPHSSAISPSPAPLPGNVKLALPAFSFSSESILPCDPFRGGPSYDAFKPNRLPLNDTRIRSVTHPNSPYVPWSKRQREWIFASAETLGGDETATSDSHRKCAKAPSTEDALGTSRQSILGRNVLGPIIRCFRSLCKSSIHPTSSSTQKDAFAASRFEPTTTLSSVQTNSLEDWLAEKRRQSILVEDLLSLNDELTSSCIVPPSLQGSLDVDAPPPTRQPTTFNFSLDCIPSPSPTITSFPCTSS